MAERIITPDSIEYSRSLVVEAAVRLGQELEQNPLVTKPRRKIATEAIPLVALMAYKIFIAPVTAKIQQGNDFVFTGGLTRSGKSVSFELLCRQIQTVGGKAKVINLQDYSSFDQLEVLVEKITKYLPPDLNFLALD